MIRPHAKRELAERLLEAALANGKTVVVCRPDSTSLYKRHGHLTSITTQPSGGIVGKRPTSFVIDDPA